MVVVSFAVHPTCNGNSAQTLAGGTPSPEKSTLDKEATGSSWESQRAFIVLPYQERYRQGNLIPKPFDLLLSGRICYNAMLPFLTPGGYTSCSSCGIQGLARACRSSDTCDSLEAKRHSLFGSRSGGL